MTTYANSRGWPVVVLLVRALRCLPRFAYALSMALLLATATIATIMFPSAARAWDEDFSYSNSDGSTVTVYRQDESDGTSHTAVMIVKGNKFWISFASAAYEYVYSKYIKTYKGNPDPDGPAGGTDKPDVEGLLKHFKGGLDLKVHKIAENTPLGQWLKSRGDGIAPRWNPSDQDGNKGPGAPPKRDDNELSLKAKAHLLEMVNEDARALRRIGTGMGTGEEGGSENAPGVGIGSHDTGRKGPDNDKKSFKDHQDKTLGKTEKLGLHPELINPDPKAKLRATAVDSQTSTVKCTTEACLAKKNGGGLK